ncbi:GNAT family N-acetyltransferase [Halobacillus fulvus]|nr:GNAT family N-acetyltransferase [Halobacillus fulvus]
MSIRHVKSSDFYTISPLINEWWGGRQMSDMLQRLFFDHFQDTSFIVETEGKIIGFLIGFISPSRKGEAYIHFVGVDPAHRKQNIGREMYEAFFHNVKEKGCHIVKAVTSPVNKTSIAYHTKVGFTIESGDKTMDSVSVFSDYDGPGEDRVVFAKNL